MEKVILSTLAYFDIFDYPLTADEIYRWLITEARRQEPKDRELGGILKDMEKKKILSQKDGFYFLSGRGKIVAIRKKRETWSLVKLRKARKVGRILFFLPWIKLIGLTGSVARNNSEKDDDIDFFIITAPKRLWLTRGLAVFFLRILGLYRQTNKITDKICPNMLVAENNLKMEPEDLFIAQEICAMKPVFERNGIHQRFLQANDWTKRFLPNLNGIRQETKEKGRDRRSAFMVIDWLEKGAQFLQVKYMEKHRTKEIISENLIKFHPHDTREEILKKHKERLQNLLKGFV